MRSTNPVMTGKVFEKVGGIVSDTPVMTINGEFYGRLDKKQVNRLVKEIRDREPSDE